MIRVGLVGCSKEKASYPCPAVEMYSPSPLFRASMHHARRTCGEVFILSAKYGLLRPGQEIEPYDLSIAEVGDLVEWGIRVANMLVRATVDKPVMVPITLVALCGAPYADAIGPYLTPRFRVEQPLRGLGIGQRKAWLARAAREAA